MCLSTKRVIPFFLGHLLSNQVFLKCWVGQSWETMNFISMIIRYFEITYWGEGYTIANILVHRKNRSSWMFHVWWRFSESLGLLRWFSGGSSHFKDYFQNVVSVGNFRWFMIFLSCFQKHIHTFLSILNVYNSQDFFLFFVKVDRRMFFGDSWYVKYGCICDNVDLHTRDACKPTSGLGRGGGVHFG